MRVFLDTNVLVSAFATRGICADVLRSSAVVGTRQSHGAAPDAAVDLAFRADRPLEEIGTPLVDTILRRACLGAQERIRFWSMSHTITVRLPKELAAWLEQVAAKTGVPQGKIVRDQLERAKAGSPRQSFMRLAGSVRGARDLSSRKGFARS